MILEELAEKIGAELVGDPKAQIESASTLEDARAGQISFLANPKYAKEVETTLASAVIVSGDVKSPSAALLKVKNPYYAFAKVVELLHGHRKHPHQGVHPKANVDPSAVVGAGTVVYPGAFIGPRAKVGRDCIIYPNAVIYDDCVLGDRVIIHGGTVVGVDGYGFATEAGVHHKVPQISNVIVEDDVEICANCSIERGALASTVIGKGTKIDNNVVIGHGVRVGPHCLLVAATAVAGSTTLGHHVVLGGQTGVAGHLHIGDGVMAGAQSGIMNDLNPGEIVLGSPAWPIGETRRVAAVWRQLPELVKRIKQLEREVETLKGTKS